MGIPEKQLSPGERVIVSTRTHWKALVVPVLILIVASAIAAFLIAVSPSGSAHKVLVIIIGVVWAIVQPWRLTLLHPFQQGFWWLVVEPPLLVAGAGALFTFVVV